MAATAARPEHGERIAKPVREREHEKHQRDSHQRAPGTRRAILALTSGRPRVARSADLRFPQKGHKIVAAVSSQTEGRPAMRKIAARLATRATLAGGVSLLVETQAEYQSFRLIVASPIW